MEDKKEIMSKEREIRAKAYLIYMQGSEECHQGIQTSINAYTQGYLDCLKEFQWTILTPGNEEKEIPLNKYILVKHHSGVYEVLKFYMDSDYGICAGTYESYVTPDDIIKFTLIKE